MNKYERAGMYNAGDLCTCWRYEERPLRADGASGAGGFWFLLIVGEVVAVNVGLPPPVLVVTAIIAVFSGLLG